MTFVKLSGAALVLLSLAACGTGGYPSDKSIDRGFDSKPLSKMGPAGIWVDPNGCDHWIRDDGVEGYLSQRLDRYGKPVCSGVAPPTHTVGDFKKSGGLVDPN